jgi:hypothetical protein
VVVSGLLGAFWRLALTGVVGVVGTVGPGLWHSGICEQGANLNRPRANPHGQLKRSPHCSPAGVVTT